MLGGCRCQNVSVELRVLPLRRRINTINVVNCCGLPEIIFRMIDPVSFYFLFKCIPETFLTLPENCRTQI